MDHAPLPPAQDRIQDAVTGALLQRVRERSSGGNPSKLVLALSPFVPQPVPDDVNDKLLESGFDFIEDYPVINNDEEACYCLERYTYEAYYQDEEDDEVSEHEF